MKQNLLFVCSANLNRSPTAENLFKNSNDYSAKSAGIFVGTNIVNQDLINWADLIFVMSEKEDGHLTLLKNNFNLDGKKVYDLDIPDIYYEGDPELIGTLKEKLSHYLTGGV